jgi:hypothetical protein
MDQGRFFDQFFGICFWNRGGRESRLVLLNFLRICVFKGPFTLFMTPLPAEDSFFWVFLVLPKRFQKTMLLRVCVCVCVPQILMYSTSCSQ